MTPPTAQGADQRHKNLLSRTTIQQPEEIALGVYRINALGLEDLLSIVLIKETDGWTLVDTGVTASIERVKRAMTALGVGPSNLKCIFLTHQHGDHTGDLKELLAWAPGTQVIVTSHEAEVISGNSDLDTPRGSLMAFLFRRAKPPGVAVERTVTEGELVAGFRVISTPGHSLGHASLLRDSDGLLVTGDAFGYLPFTIGVDVRKAFCADLQQAKCSAERSLHEPFTTVVMAHGPVLREGARTKLQKAVERCQY